MIQRDFLPATAESLAGVLKRSVEFAKVYEQEQQPQLITSGSEAEDLGPSVEIALVDPVASPAAPPINTWRGPEAQSTAPGEMLQPMERPDSHDRIPVRLSGGRRAWLLIPQVFREADKQRLKAQIDLLLTEDDEES